MKKKFIYVGVLCLWATKSLAQLNVQLHYDLGHGMYGNEISSRQHLTATVENFSADKWGSTYFLWMPISVTMFCVEPMASFPGKSKRRKCRWHSMWSTTVV